MILNYFLFSTHITLLEAPIHLPQDNVELQIHNNNCEQLMPTDPLLDASVQLCDLDPMEGGTFSKIVSKSHSNVSFYF